MPNQRAPHMQRAPDQPARPHKPRLSSWPGWSNPTLLQGYYEKMMKTYYLYEKLWRKIHLCLKSPTFFRKFGKCRFGFACQIWLKRGRILVSLPCLFTRHPHFYTSGGPKWSSKGSNHPFPCLIMFGMYNPIYGMYNPIKITSYN